jgi:sulfatase maturation enzyme AslB (radical SAM superfamily)
MPGASAHTTSAITLNNVQAEFFDTIGVYEVQLSTQGGARLVPTWRFKVKGSLVYKLVIARALHCTAADSMAFYPSAATGSASAVVVAQTSKLQCCRLDQTGF